MTDKYSERDPNSRQPDVSDVQYLVQALAVHRKEAQLYPSGHPRLVQRLGQLVSGLRERIPTCGCLLLMISQSGLQVASSEGVLTCDSEPVRELSALLRERMIQSVRLYHGLGESEVEYLLAILLELPRTIVARELASTDSLGIERMPSFVQTGASTFVASDGHVPINDPLLDPRFADLSEQQLRMIRRVMSAKQVVTRVERFKGRTRGDSGPKVDFVSEFFCQLAQDRQVDWEDEHQLRKMMVAGMDLVEQVVASGGLADGVPARLLAPGQGFSDQLMTHFRWRLLNSLFPGRKSTVESPRPEEQLSTSSETAADWPPREAPDPEWGATAPARLVRGFELQFEQGACLGEYMTVCSELLSLPAIGALVQPQHFKKMLVQELSKQSTLTTTLHQLRDEPAWRQLYKSEFLPVGLLQSLTVSEVLEVFFSMPSALLKDLLEQPPKNIGQPIVLKDQHSQVRETVRQLLEPCDKMSLGVAYGFLERCDPLVQSPWFPIFKAVVKRVQPNARWISSRAERLFSPRNVELILQLPSEQVYPQLKTYLQELADEQHINFIQGLSRHCSSEVTRYLVIGLGALSQEVRLASISALGKQRDSRALSVLEGALAGHNIGDCDPKEVLALCQALAELGSYGGLSCLKQVVEEKTGVLSHAWTRTIRGIAKMVLSENRSSS